MDTTDVVVVGAGPTGLLLASELALAGVQVIVLERLREPDMTIKAGSINVASAEILDRRGLLPAAQAAQQDLLRSVARFAEGGSTAHGIPDRPFGRFPVVGHFAGMFFRGDLVDQEDPLLTAHLAAADGVLVSQGDLEALLTTYCARLGVEIRRGIEVRRVHSAGTDLRDDADVVVETDAGEVRAGWVVAADGGRSAIRKQLDIPFVGTEPQLVGYQAVVDIDDPTGLERGWTWTPRGVYTYGPTPGRILVARFGSQPVDRDAPVSLEEFQDVVREVTGAHVTLTGMHGRATRWSDNARQAQTYRRGRVLVAGDAAHVHSPFSGQGLNLGLGDAVNLGWKLAATIQGWAPAGLLDTYETERHPIAAWVLDWTRAQVALMRGDEHTAQLREVVQNQLLTVPGAMNRVVALTSGITQRYEVSDGAKDDPSAATVGSVAGDVLLGSGGRLADHAHEGRFVLVDRSSDQRFTSGVEPWAARVTTVADPGAGAHRQSLLVRPDGVIAWAAGAPSKTAQCSPPTLEAALARWTGRP